MNQNNTYHAPGKKFYFTYGSDPAYPFQGGWTLVYAPDLKAAQQIFKAYHPNRPGSDALNCADYYPATIFEQIIASLDGPCHEVIMAMPATYSEEAELLIYRRATLCPPCRSPDCAYVNAHGICLYALVHETMPDLECENGCSGYCEGPKNSN